MPFLNYGSNLPLAMLGQAQAPSSPRMQPLDLGQLGLGSVPEWQTLIPDQSTDPYKNKRFNYAGPEISPVPGQDNYSGSVVDPNDPMLLQMWQNLFGRQIGGRGNL
jgi:hypothetical protein